MGLRGASYCGAVRLRLVDGGDLAGKAPSPNAAESHAAGKLPPMLNRLSLMMFLQYAIWGAWLPLLWPYLSTVHGFSPDEIFMVFAMGAVGAIVAPFIAGQVADRWFNTERYLALAHILGGVLIFQLADLNSLNEFIGFSLVYSMLYSPTMPLSNALAFAHMPDRERFGRVRLWGTVGWIAVGIAMGQFLLYYHSPAGQTGDALSMSQAQGMANAFRLSGILGIAMGLYCFTLPATPPKRGRSANAFGEAVGEILRSRELLTIFLLAVPVSCIHQFYFVHTSGFLGSLQRDLGGNDPFAVIFGVGGGGLMTVGQMAEIVVLGLMGSWQKCCSKRSLFMIGLLAYGLRMFCFAYGADIAAAVGISPLVVMISGVALHGIVFGCYIFLAFIVLDEHTSGDVRASAQSLFNLVIVGVGVIVGSWISGEVAKWATVEGKLDYQRLFSVPMWASLACLALFFLMYPRHSRPSVAQGG